MQILLWMTAGVLVKVEAGGPDPEPPVNHGGGGVDRYRRRRRALNLYLRKLESQRRLDAELGVVLTPEALELRAKRVDDRISRINQIQEDIQVNLRMAEVDRRRAALEYEVKLKEYAQAKAVQDELESHEVIEKFLDYTDRHAEEFSNAALKHRAERASEHHREAQERAQEEAQEEAELHEALIASGEKAARVREIELEIATLKREEELAQSIAAEAKRRGHVPKPHDEQEAAKAAKLMARINEYMMRTK